MLLAAATMLAAALVPVPLAPASRAAAVVRASRPVMLVEAAETVVQSGLLVDSVVDMPLLALSDSADPTHASQTTQRRRRPASVAWRHRRRHRLARTSGQLE